MTRFAGPPHQKFSLHENQNSLMKKSISLYKMKNSKAKKHNPQEKSKMTPRKKVPTEKNQK